VGERPVEGRSAFGRLASAIYPDLDFARWRRRRRRVIARELKASPYRRLAPPPRARHDRDTPLVVIVPQEGEDFESFRPGTRNFYYEAAQSLREKAGEARVSVFSVHPGEPPPSWHGRLLEHLWDVGATHLLTHIEHDPGSAGTSFTWDTFWSLAAPRWDGDFLGVMFDSAYPWIKAGSRHLARIDSRYLIVDICMPMDGAILRGRPEIGPINMPVSRESIALVDERLAGVVPQWDVSFIGVLYPHRIELIERLRALGVDVAVNPHRADQTVDVETSRSTQPSWLDYMAGLRSSRMTINFSRSSAGPYEQLKTRVLEATLAGTLLLTDDLDRTRHFFAEGAEFVPFRDAEALPGVIAGLMEDPERVARIAQAGEARARALAPVGFWEGIDAGLRRRGLRTILGSASN
jgi:hypothetical protein